MEPKKIIIAFPFSGNELGGSHISALGLIEGLNREKFTPVIVLHETGATLEKRLRLSQALLIAAPTVHLPSLGARATLSGRVVAMLRFMQTTAKLVAFLRKNKIDVVHTNDGQMHTTWALAARLAGARLLWHHRGDPAAWGVNLIAPVLANHIVTVSRFVQPVKPIVPVAHKITVLHSPFEHPAALPDRGACRKQFIEELRLPSETRFVGYVGSLVERKRPVRFVEAVHAFLQRHPHFPLHGLVFGSSVANFTPLEDAIMKRAQELGIADRVHLMGFRVPVIPCMGALDALLVPALNEPFGRTLIEAMLLETPVIATNHGGNPEAIVDGETGYLVTPEQPQAFVAPLEKLLFDPDQWKKISNAARRNALVTYGSKAHIDGISRLYERLIASGSAHDRRVPQPAQFQGK